MKTTPGTQTNAGADRLGRPVGAQVGVRRLIFERLGLDPGALARTLRDTQPPMSWNRIAQEIMNRTEVDGLEPIYLTQEAVRRWVMADDRAAAKDAEETAA